MALVSHSQPEPGDTDFEQGEPRQAHSCYHINAPTRSKAMGKPLLERWGRVWCRRDGDG